MDAMDDGDSMVPPQFSCEKCGGTMYPEYYKGLHGYEYKISDIQNNKRTEAAVFDDFIKGIISEKKYRGIIDYWLDYESITSC